MANTTNFNWETPDDTDLVKDGAAAIRTLGSAIDTSLVDLKGGTTDQVLAKNSNTDMDFKWVTSDDANAIQNAIVDAKGDIIAASASDTPARLAVGTDNQRLVAASGEATGLKYVADTQNTVIDAAGDLLYGTAADTVGRLAIGTAGQVLKVNSGATAPEWGAAGGASGLVFINKTDYTASVAVNINNVFTTTYDNYRVYVVDDGSAGGTVTFSIKLRASGSDTTTNYQSQKLSASNTTVSASKNDLGNDEIFLGDGGSSTFPKSPLIFDINSPFTTTFTSVVGAAYLSRDVSASSPILQMVSGAHTAATSFDGFTLILGNSSSGSIYIYGYAKA
jgi:hypothetical protein